MQRNEQQEKFIQGIKTIRDYWLSLPDKTAEEIVDGVLFSTFVMFDGDSSANDFHALAIIDRETNERIDCGHLPRVIFQGVRSRQCEVFLGCPEHSNHAHRDRLQLEGIEGRKLSLHP